MPATYVETRSIPLEDLIPFPGNARRGNVDAIRGSVRANGQYRALVVRQLPDGSLVVLGGNHTKEALAAEGYATARCDVIECTDDEATRIVLADNRTADLGGYEDASLLELLESLDDLDGTGYHDEDYDQLLAATDVLGSEAADFLAPTIGNQAVAGEESQERAGTDPASPADTTTLVQVSWLVDVPGREMIRTAIKIAQDRTGAETAAAALVAVARDYIERSAS